MGGDNPGNYNLPAIINAIDVPITTATVFAFGACLNRLPDCAIVMSSVRTTSPPLYLKKIIQYPTFIILFYLIEYMSKQGNILTTGPTASDHVVHAGKANITINQINTPSTPTYLFIHGMCMLRGRRWLKSPFAPLSIRCTPSRTPPRSLLCLQHTLQLSSTCRHHRAIRSPPFLPLWY